MNLHGKLKHMKIVTCVLIKLGLRSFSTLNETATVKGNKLDNLANSVLYSKAISFMHVPTTNYWHSNCHNNPLKLFFIPLTFMQIPTTSLHFKHIVSIIVVATFC
jgi:hypothetical protein